MQKLVTNGVTKRVKERIQIDGETVNMATPTERGVAMVFQNYALYAENGVGKTGCSATIWMRTARQSG
jgi:ABC-type sugar transport system ATPase subunit